MYVIKRGKEYVAKPGGEHSYTKKLELAQMFSTKEEAEKNKCDNEYIVSVYAIMKKSYWKYEYSLFDRCGDCLRFPIKRWCWHGLRFVYKEKMVPCFKRKKNKEKK